MSVKARALVTTSIILLFMGAAFYTLARLVLLDRFYDLEIQDQTGSMEQINQAVNRVYTDLGRSASDWAVWDDLDAFLRGQNPDFPQKNLTREVYSGMDLNLVAFADNDGKILFSQVYSPADNLMQAGPQELLHAMARGGLFWGLAGKTDFPSRLLVTSQGNFLVVGRPVYPTSGNPPSSGTLLFGRRIDQSLVDTLSKDTNLSLGFFLVGNAPREFLQIQPQITPDKNFYINTIDKTNLSGFVIVKGLDGQPAGVFEVHLPRLIYEQASIALNYLLLGMVAVAATALLVNWGVSTLYIFRPMERLVKRVQRASNLQDQIHALAPAETDELVSLSGPLQDALIRAHEAQKERDDRDVLVMRLFEQAREGFAILEPHSLKVLEANQEYTNLVGGARGHKPDTRPFPEQIETLLSSKSQSDFNAWLAEVRGGAGGIFELEIEAQHDTQFLEVSLYPIEVGGRSYLYVLLRDVSERRKLERSLKQRLNETILLNRVIAVSTSNMEPEAVFQAVCEQLATAFNLPQSSLVVLDEERQVLRYVAEYMTTSRPSVLGIEIALTGPFLSRDFNRSRAPVAFVEANNDPRLEPFLKLIELRDVESIMFVPLIIRADVIGMLILESVERRVFSQTEIELAQNIASAASRAYEVTQLYHSLQEQLQQRQRAEEDLARRERFLEALVDVQTRMLGGTQALEVYTAALKILGEVSRSDRLYIFRNHVGIDGGLYTSLAAEWVAPGIRPELNNPSMQNMVFTGSLQRIYDLLSVGQPYFAVVSELPKEEQASYLQKGVRSFLVLPLTASGTFNGLIGFDDIRTTHHWQPGEVSLLMVAAAAISMAQDRFDAIEASRQSEERYRAVVENAHDVIFQLDLSGQFIFLNPSWERLTGIPLQDSIGLPFWKVAPVGMLQQLQTAYRILREKVTDQYHQTLVFNDKNGEPVWLETYARLITDAEGRGMLISGTMIDITLFKRIEYQLRRNEESLRALYDITSSQRQTFEQKIKDLLLMGGRTFGLDIGSLGRIDGENLIIEHFYPDEDVGAGVPLKISETYTREILRANEPVGVEHVSETDWADHPAFRKYRDETILGTPVLVDKQVYGLLTFSSKKPRLHGFSIAEKEFARLMAQWIGAEIERDRYTRRLQLYNEEIAQKSSELAEARDEALEASRLKSEFLATMSHEIRTPLNAVIGMTELLLDTPLNAHQEEFAHIIQDSGRSLLGIINDILDFSKIEAGRLSLEVVEFELLPVVEGVVDMFLPAAKNKGVSILSYVSPEIPRFLMGDPARLRQVLVNLIGNALKFTEVGEVVIRVGLQGVDDLGVSLLCKVNDTGIGLSEVARRRLFQPFTQADGSTTRKYGGTGLGLAISKRLVEMMGGEIGVFSEEDVGSTFWFTLRMQQPQAGVGAAPSPDLDLAGMRVLVAESDPTQRRFLSAYLKSWKLSPEPARAPIEALEMLERSLHEQVPYAMLIWGLDSPGMNWDDLRAYLDQHPELSEIKTVFLADLDQRGNVNAISQPGRSIYLVRPVKQSGLFNVITDLFSPVSSPVAVKDLQPGAQPVEQKVRNGKRILLAEDNPANQRLALAQLERLGYQAELVPNGARAFEAYSAHPGDFDLILMDCQMPVMDGFESSQRIRDFEHHSGSRVPIIAMTANAMQGDREACLAAGMDDYISKPVTIDHLRRALEQIDEIARREKESPVNPGEPSEHDPLDPEILRGLRELQEEGEPDFLTELIDLFLEDSAGLVNQMKTALQQNDFQAVRQAAHTLKGSSGSLGAVSLSKLCVEIESRTRNGKPDGMGEIFSQIEGEYAVVRRRLMSERVS